MASATAASAERCVRPDLPRPREVSAAATQARVAWFQIRRKTWFRELLRFMGISSLKT
jgi:hypothetical protein